VNVGGAVVPSLVSLYLIRFPVAIDGVFVTGLVAVLLV
jgi:uncharacterized membrane protein